eukprot:comp22119_c1_seq2/m.51561 comp22119_c1_seq2/g.51561  ORF comp22119_c1_seq2/g.51561 comp22119_c1_seq2/m.51561 type:complete len:959 (+) comp22119_c1_seq2:49-2925(+)
MLPLVLVAVAVFFSAGVEAQLPSYKCIPQQVANAYINSTFAMCNTVVNYDVAIDAAQTDTLAAFITMAKSAGPLVQLALSMGSPNCKKLAVKFACAAFYLRCNSVPLPTGTVAIPSPPDLGLCTNFAGTCDHVISMVYPPQLVPFNCSDSSKFPNNTLTLAPGLAVPTNKMADNYTWPSAVTVFPSSDLTRRCVPMDPNSICGRVIPGRVFVNETLTLGVLNKLASDSFKNFGLAPAECKIAALRFICGKAFMKCDDTQVSIAAGLLNAANPTIPWKQTFIALPNLAQQSVCSDFHNTCKRYLRFGSGIPFWDSKWSPSMALGENCTDLQTDGSLSGFYKYPPMATYLLRVQAIPGQTFFMTMNNVTDQIALDYFAEIRAANRDVVGPQNCPPPLKYKVEMDVNDSIPCAVPCPRPPWTDREYSIIFKTLAAIGAMGCLGTLFTSLTYLIIAEKRRFPGNLIFYFAISSFNVSFAFFVGGVSGPSKLLCDGPFKTAGFGHGLCVWQGVWVLFWATSAALWWATIAFNLYVGIAFNKKHTSHYAKYYHIFVWGVPFVNTLIVLANEEVGYANTPWCFITEVHNFAFQFAFFYAWIITVTSVGVFCMSAVLVKMVQISRMTGRAVTAQLRAQLRSICFILMIIFVFSAIISYRIQAVVNATPWQDSVQDQVACNLLNLKAGRPTDCQLRKPRPVFSTYYAITITTSIQAILVTLFYGISMDNLNGWLYVLGLKKPPSKALPQSTKQLIASGRADAKKASSTPAAASTTTSSSNLAAPATKSASASSQPAPASKTPSSTDVDEKRKTTELVEKPRTSSSTEDDKKALQKKDDPPAAAAAAPAGRKSTAGGRASNAQAPQQLLATKSNDDLLSDQEVERSNGNRAKSPAPGARSSSDHAVGTPSRGESPVPQPPPMPTQDVLSSVGAEADKKRKERMESTLAPPVPEPPPEAELEEINIEQF